MRGSGGAGCGPSRRESSSCSAARSRRASSSEASIPTAKRGAETVDCTSTRSSSRRDDPPEGVHDQGRDHRRQHRAADHRDGGLEAALGRRGRRPTRRARARRARGPARRRRAMMLRLERTPTIARSTSAAAGAAVRSRARSPPPQTASASSATTPPRPPTISAPPIQGLSVSPAERDAKARHDEQAREQQPGASAASPGGRVGAPLDGEPADVEAEQQHGDERGGDAEEAGAEARARRAEARLGARQPEGGQAPDGVVAVRGRRRGARAGGASDRRDGDVLLGGDGHRGTSRTTVVPEPCAEKTRALPPTSSRRPTIDSR